MIGAVVLFVLKVRLLLCEVQLLLRYLEGGMDD